jgi:hypothetical protein
MQLRAVRTAADISNAHRIIADALPPVLASVLAPDQLELIRQRLLKLPAHLWTLFANSLLGYFSVTSGNSINSHLFASVIQASRMRAKYWRSSGSSASFASAAHLAAVSHAVSRLDRI